SGINANCAAAISDGLIVPAVIHVGGGPIDVRPREIRIELNRFRAIRNRSIDRAPLKIGNCPTVVSLGIDRFELYCSGAVCNGLTAEALFDIGIAAPCIRLLTVWVGFYCFGGIQNNLIIRFVLQRTLSFLEIDLFGYAMDMSRLKKTYYSW